MKKGTHGTCRSYAEEILANGFKATDGRIGKGTYFWAYFSDETEFCAKELAASWWRHSKQTHKYDHAKDNRCTVIYVEINSTDDSYLDLEDTDIKAKLIAFANQTYRKDDQRDYNKHKALGATYDLFIKLMEEALNIEFDIVHIRVAPPGGYRPPLPIEITGAPSCFLVMNDNCINIAGTKHVN